MPRWDAVSLQAEEPVALTRSEIFVTSLRLAKRSADAGNCQAVGWGCRFGRAARRRGSMGFDPPSLCVQVKLGSGPVNVGVIQRLHGSMKQVGADQGPLIAWGGFNAKVPAEERNQFFCDPALGLGRSDSGSVGEL